MEEGVGARFWCHTCMQAVNPTGEAELKCPLCQSGFIEEMHSNASTRSRQDESDLASTRALSLWAPIVLGMMGNPLSRRFRRHFVDDHSYGEGNENRERLREGENELDRELNTIRRSSAAFLHLLQGISAGVSAESEASEREREQERVVLVNPFNQRMVVQGPGNPNPGQNMGQSPFGSIGDYFIGHALDMLLQHLAENDPNRHGTRPAKREAVDALKTVKVKEDLQCPVCLDDFEISAEAKEMPCKHKFHGGCITPWLELHSTCPVCRFELPVDESKRDSEVTRSGNTVSLGNTDVRGGNETNFALPWPLNAILSPPTPRGSSLVPAPSAPSSGTTSGADGN